MDNIFLALIGGFMIATGVLKWNWFTKIRFLRTMIAQLGYDGTRLALIIFGTVFLFVGVTNLL